MQHLLGKAADTATALKEYLSAGIALRYSRV